MFQISYKRIGIALVGMLMSLSPLFGALPAGYTQLAFLESSGTQYIDTGVVFGKTNGFSITYQVVAPEGNQIICGSRNDDGDTRCILGSNSSYYHTYMTNGTSVATNTYRQSLAYVGWNEPTPWSKGRHRAFEECVRADGKPFSAFTESWTAADRLNFHTRLAKWLKLLPKPCGLFAANDDTASQVADACHFCGLKIPQDVAIIGVDNLEIICENATTSLSSIAIDFYAAGLLCADYLAELLANPRLRPGIRAFGPGQIVRRQSTRRLLHSSPVVERALEKIRREACFGLTAADVIAEMKLPRRGAERRFRQATGSSILEEINRHRLERAFSLLRRPGYPIALIAQQCGWSNDVFLKRLFKRATGLTMREWRKREGVQSV